MPLIFSKLGFSKRLSTLLPVLALCGCAAVGPNYEAPEIQTPDAWSAQIDGQMAPDQQASLQTWWQTFNDPVLNDLIQRAGHANLDLKVAVSRVVAARAILAGTRGGEQPSVTAGAEAGFERQSASESFTGIENNVESYELGVNAGWEIDVFGRVRRTIEAAGAKYQASIEDYRDVMVSLYADVATAYIDIRSTQQSILITQTNASSMSESLGLSEDRFESGVSSRLDVVQATANLASTLADIPSLQIRLNAAINRLAVLLGQDPGSLQGEFSETQPMPMATGLVGIGVPAEVLRQRPDIRQAERLLAAQSAEVGVATAALYPSFSLAGFFGLQSNSLSSLFDSSALAWGLKSPVQWSVFNGGTVRSNIDYQNAILQQRLLQYEQKVLKAIGEVENAISAFNLNQTRDKHLVNATAATQEAVNLVLVQYNSGLTDYNNVLTTQRDLLDQQNLLVATRTSIEISLVDLYKALGGGWSPDETTLLDEESADRG